MTLPVAPKRFQPILRALDLDSSGLDRGIDRLVRSTVWPVLVAVAGGVPDPVLRKAVAKLQRPAGPDEAWRLALLGKCSLYGRRGDAADFLKGALRLEPGLSQAKLWLAEETLGRGRPGDVLALDGLPSAAWAQALRAGDLMRCGRPAEAAAELERALILEPRRPWLRVLRSEALAQAVRNAEAVEEATRAAGLALRSPWAQLLLARCVFNCGGDRSLALPALRRALRLAPRHPEGLIMKAEFLRRKGRFAEALRAYGRVESSGVSFSRLYAWRGSLLRQMGRLKQALPDLDRAVRESPEYSLPLYERAQANLRLERWEQAFSDMAAAARLDSKHGWAHERPGEGGEADKTLALLEKAARKLRSSPWPKAWLGESLLARGRHEEALARLDEALERDPGCGWALAWRGETRLAAGDLPGALADLTKAVKLDPSYSRAQGRLGIALAQKGRTAPARRAFDAAIALDGRCAWTLGRRGELRLMSGDAKGALEDIDRALELDRGYADAYLWRGAARMLMGADGSADLRRAVELKADAGWIERWSKKQGGVK